MCRELVHVPKPDLAVVANAGLEPVVFVLVAVVDNPTVPAEFVLVAVLHVSAQFATVGERIEFHAAYNVGADFRLQVTPSTVHRSFFE